MKHFLLLIALSLLIGSCSITKRRYNNGWHVEWHKKHHNSGQEPSVADNNNTIRLTEIQTHDSIVERTSIASPGITETETISPMEESKSISSEEDSPSLPEQPSVTTNSGQIAMPTKAKSDHGSEEKKREAFPNSERVIPIPLAVILAILLVGVGIYLSAGVSAVFLLLIALSGATFSSIAIIIAVFFGVITFMLVLMLVFHLFNRKETKYASKRERNLRYALYAFCIASVIGSIAVIAIALSFYG